MKNLITTVLTITSLGLGSLCSVLHADLSVSITPPDDPVVNPATGIQLTADATTSEKASCLTFDWTDEDGDWGTGTVTGKESILSYYPEGDTYGTDDDVTCTVTDQNGNTDMDDVKLYIPMIQTTTIESSTAPDTRSTIGIGEEVNCMIEPNDTPGGDSTTWTNSGSGSLSTSTGSGVTYAAYSNEESDTVTATLGDSNSTAVTVTFNIILPTATVQPLDLIDYVGTNNIGVEFHTYVYMGPDSVNFYNCGFHEGTCSAAASGYFSYANGDVHNPGSSVAALSTSVISGWGTYIYATDDVAVITRGTPYSSPGSFNWPIPDYWVLNGIQGQYMTQNETAVMNYQSSEYSETLTKSISSETSNNYP